MILGKFGSGKYFDEPGVYIPSQPFLTSLRLLCFCLVLYNFPPDFLT